MPPVRRETLWCDGKVRTALQAEKASREETPPPKGNVSNKKVLALMTPKKSAVVKVGTNTILLLCCDRDWNLFDNLFAKNKANWGKY